MHLAGAKPGYLGGAIGQQEARPSPRSNLHLARDGSGEEARAESRPGARVGRSWQLHASFRLWKEQRERMCDVLCCLHGAD